jgi:hypothetical protein
MPVARRSLKSKLKHPSEKEIENSIIDTLNILPHCKVWKNQSAGIFDPQKKVFRKLTKYQIRGVSDILGIYRGKMLCLEVKSKTGKLTDEQKNFLFDMELLGAVTGCVRSVSDALDLLSKIDNSCK